MATESDLRTVNELLTWFRLFNECHDVKLSGQDKNESYNYALDNRSITILLDCLYAEKFRLKELFGSYNGLSDANISAIMLEEEPKPCAIKPAETYYDIEDII